jgi:hypothetical protein
MGPTGALAFVLVERRLATRVGPFAPFRGTRKKAPASASVGRSSRPRGLSEPCRAGKRNTPPASMDRQRSPASRRENGRHSPPRRQSATRGWAYETPRSSRSRRADASRNPAADTSKPLRVVTRTQCIPLPDRVALDSKTTRRTPYSTAGPGQQGRLERRTRNVSVCAPELSYLVIQATRAVCLEGLG